MSSGWLQERAITDAEQEARERLERYATEREQRMAGYRLAWERRWAAARSVAAASVPSLWRVK